MSNTKYDMDMGPYKLDEGNKPELTTWDAIRDAEKARDEDKSNETAPLNRVALSHFGKYKISTVFLRASFGFGLFETMVFFQDLGCCGQRRAVG